VLQNRKPYLLWKGIKKKATTMRTQRQLRVGEELRHILAGILMRGDAPWPDGFRTEGAPITVTEVQVSPDLQNATVFVMPLGGKQLSETVRALNTIAGFFRHEVGKGVKLRYIPKLRFQPDTTFENAQRINTILHDPEVAKDLAKPEKED
jgi:ribosome-binding factor A